ncbi:MAG: hypothetical protein U1A25_01440 [Candidatus Sungbacteria bacterium]|nr:hypothetical protein [bacterium]MDZ4260304.1 hypothetical protein [Candidatus Sungbacteria bacterium]
MGTVTKAMRNDCPKYYGARALFFDVLVTVRCSHALKDQSDLHFDLTFEEKTALGNPSQLLQELLCDGVLDQIRKLSILKARYPRNDELNRARTEKKMTVTRPRPSSFEDFKSEVLNTLEGLEEIFHALVSPFGSVMELSFSKGTRI